MCAGMVLTIPGLAAMVGGVVAVSLAAVVLGIVLLTRRA